ncbi:MAG: endolytic transglycosylase MltG [Acutalibacteraceae bacterium]|nr:endolytic transglycosylase MltG [Acutalibacteraceae bacterium]
MCLSLTACGNRAAEESNTAKITFPEGSTVIQIANALEKNGVCKAADFEKAANTIPASYDRLFQDYDPKGRLFALEGYLFPDTYEFYKGEKPSMAVMRFLDNANQKITDQDIKDAKAMGYTLDQVLTLASIIQTEASDPAQMPKVSSVFHNRLNSGNFPYIGSDVTRQYIEVKSKDYIEMNCPAQYDTLFGNYCTNDGYPHKTKGLPIGPICSCGTNAIRSALHPDKDKYLYFFTDPQGGYHYNVRLQDHQVQYAKFQKAASGKAAAKKGA